MACGMRFGLKIDRVHPCSIQFPRVWGLNASSRPVVEPCDDVDIGVAVRESVPVACATLKMKGFEVVTRRVVGFEP